MGISIKLSSSAFKVIRDKAASLGISVETLASEIVEHGVKLVELGIGDAKLDRNGSSPSQRSSRPARVKLTADESLKRMNDFDQRRDQFIASIRKSKG